MVCFALMYLSLFEHLLGNYVAREHNFWFPVLRFGNVFHDDAAATGTVYAENTLCGAFYDHGYVLNVSAPAKKHEIARNDLIEGDFHALHGLSGGAGRHFYVEFFQNVTGKTGAIETGSRRNTGIAVFKAEKILRISGDIIAHLHHFIIFGTGIGCGK